MQPGRSSESAGQEPAREALLRLIWEEVRGFDAGNIGNYPSAARAVESGAKAEDVAKAMQVAAYDVAFRLAYLLTGEHCDPDAEGECMGWTLDEVLVHPDGTLSRTDSDSLNLLHESLLGADPTGREGQDLFS